MAIDQDFLHSLESSAVDVNRAEALPPEVYTSERFFEFEKQAIFDHDWFCVGHEGQLPNPGSYITLTFVDEPLIVVRGRDHEIRVLSAVCRHRGMVIAEGKGDCSTFRCPYHFWTYGLDGRFLAAPAMERREGFAKENYGLHQLKVETWNGFIFANFDDSATPLAPSLSSLDQFLQHFRLNEAAWLDGGTIAELPWNWKIMHENFNDGYHNDRLHHGIGDVMACDQAVFMDFDESRDNHITRHVRTKHIDASFNPTMKTLLPVFPALTEEERSRWAFALVPPTLAIAVVPDEVAYFIVLPNSAREIAIQIGYLFDPGVVKLPLFDLLFEQAKAGVHNFNVQDIHADTLVQKGLRSRYAPRGPYSWQEETLQQFNRWLVKRYRAAATRET